MVLTGLPVSGRPLQVGDRVPEIVARDQDGQKVRLGFEGVAVLYFYPEDETPGCVTEACQFRDDLPDYQEMGARVVGVSTDDVTSHRHFAEKHQLTHPLLSDPGGEISRRFGVLDENGRARRVTFVITDGVITRVFPRVNPNGHSRDVWMALFGATRA
jgi:peroxiredoxin Q/BCP